MSDNEMTEKVLKKRKVSMLQLFIVGLICAILGGAVVFGASELFDDESAGTDSNGKKILIEQTYENLVPAIAEKVSPSVVGVKTTVTIDNFFLGQSQGTGAGTGIIISSDGYILTNNHVITEALKAGTNELAKDSKIEVLLPGRQDEPYTAEVIGRDELTDIAVIKIDAVGLPAAEFGDSDELTIGEPAIAIGNPGGFEFMSTVSAGIISGLNRNLQTGTGTELNLIQTDAAINPGNSGGPLCNSKGQVIGVTSIKIVATGFEGLGFAIPVNQAKSISDQLIETGYVKGRPLLGISIDNTFNEDVAKQYDVPPGVLVKEVQPFSGAYEAGIKTNDIITKFDGEEVKTFDELQKLKNDHVPGDTVEIEVYRYSEEEYMTFDVTLTEDKGTS